MHLREYIESRGFTQVEFAKMLGIHVNTLRNYLTRQKRPNINTAIQIERLTKGKVTIDELNDLDDQKKITSESKISTPVKEEEEVECYPWGKIKIHVLPDGTKIIDSAEIEKILMLKQIQKDQS